MLVAYFFIEYGRPMDVIPGLAALRPGLVVTVLLGLSLVTVRTTRHLASGSIRLMFLFVLYLAVHVPLAHNNGLAFGTAKTLAVYLVFVVSLSIHVDTFERARNMVFCWVLLGSYVCTMALINNGIGGSSFLGDENDLALFSNVMLPLAFTLFWTERKAAWKMFYLSAAILALFSVVVSFSRGGFVGLFAGLFSLWLMGRRKLLGIAALAAVLAIVALAGGERYREEMATIGDAREKTASDRIELWKSAWSMFRDNPWGVGGGNYSIRLPDYQTEAFSRNMWGKQVHSLWLQLLAETGVIGALLFGLLLWRNLKALVSMRRLRQREDDRCRYAAAVATGLLAALGGYFASATFLSVLYYPHYWYLTAAIVVLHTTIREPCGSP